MLARMRFTSRIRRLVFHMFSENFSPYSGLPRVMRSESECPSNLFRPRVSSARAVQAEPGSSVGNLCFSDSLGRSFIRFGRQPDRQGSARYFAAQASRYTYTEEVDDINSKFAEARDDIEMALESKETVYFDAEAETARTSVKAVLDKYEALLARLDEKNKGIVQRSMGLKMEQLKAELKQLELDREK